MIKTKNFISAFIIITMVSGIFALPILNNNTVQAASKKVKITYKINGGKFSAKKYKNKKSYSKKINKGKKTGTLPKVKRTGYSLKGWYTKKSGGKKVTAKTKIKKNTKLYARWKANSYTVTFDARNGNSPVSKKVKFNKEYSSVLATPKLPGNKFMGWYTSPNGGKKVTKQKSTKKITLYAHWEITNQLGIDSNKIDIFAEKLANIIKNYNLDFNSHTKVDGSNYYLYRNEQEYLEFVFKEDKCIVIMSEMKWFFPKLNSDEVTDSELAKIYGQGIYNEEGEYTEYRIGKLYFYAVDRDADKIIDFAAISTLPFEVLEEIDFK